MGLSASKKARRRAKRDATAVASPSLSQLLSPIKPTPRPIVTTAPKKLTKIEDRRTYHPQGPQRPARSVQKAHHKLRAISARRSSPQVVKPPRRLRKAVQKLSDRIGFEGPRKVLICIRRRMRKEVMFALGKTGAGAKARTHHQSYYSSIRC